MASQISKTLSFDESSEYQEPCSLFVGGDCVLDDALGRPPVSDTLRHCIDEAGLSLVNLEAPVPVDREPVSKSGPALQAAADAPATLADMGVDAVTLANNHAMDFGEEGLERTRHECMAHGLGTCGAAPTADEALSPFYATVGESSIAVISVCEQEFGLAKHDEPGTAWARHPSLSRHIEDATTNSDIVVVVDHGGIEYVPFPPPGRQARFRGFVDAGADVVIGHHPHVPQGWEVYRNSPILYSLGNFLLPMPDRPSANWGMAAVVNVADGTPVNVELILTEVVGDTVHELGRQRDREESLTYLNRLAEITATPGALSAHWQEVAVQTFDRRYAQWLGNSVSDRCSLRHLPERVLPGIDPTPRFDESDVLTLLNLVRNESHHELLLTALELRASECPDYRSPEVRETVDELLRWTRDDDPYGRRELGSTLAKAKRRLRDLVS